MGEVEEQPLDEPFVAPDDPRTELVRRERIADDTVPMHDLVHPQALGRVNLDHIRDERFHEFEPIAFLTRNRQRNSNSDEPSIRQNKTCLHEPLSNQVSEVVDIGWEWVAKRVIGLMFRG